MDKQERKEFDALFVEKLRVIYKENKNIKITKNIISFLDVKKNKIARLYLQYVVKAQAYSLLGAVFGGEVCQFTHEAQPPYNSNLINNEYCCGFHSANERYNEFSDTIIGKQCKLPTENINEFTDRIIERIIKNHIPRIMNCISGLTGLMQDVMRYPSDYNYPLIVFVYAAMKQGLAFDSPLVQEAMKRQDMIGDRKFDCEFAQKWLTSPILPAEPGLERQ
jgi:hypothetical protein